jgi:hypothetical protein
VAPWPEPCSYDRDWLDEYRRQVARPASTHAQNSSTQARRVRIAARLRSGSDSWRHWRKAVHLEYMSIYRTLADPAYLDPTIDPDDRPLGSLLRSPIRSTPTTGGAGSHAR